MGQSKKRERKQRMRRRAQTQASNRRKGRPVPAVAQTSVATASTRLLTNAPLDVLTEFGFYLRALSGEELRASADVPYDQLGAIAAGTHAAVAALPVAQRAVLHSSQLAISMFSEHQFSIAFPLSAYEDNAEFQEWACSIGWPRERWNRMLGPFSHAELTSAHYGITFGFSGDDGLDMAAVAEAADVARKMHWEKAKETRA